MVVHDIVDALRGHGKYSVAFPSVVPQTYREHLAAKLVQAEKFEIKNIPLEGRVSDGMYNVPRLDDNETEYWTAGLLPLPKELTWYEFSVATNTVHGMLIEERPGISPRQKNWHVTRMDISGRGVVLLPITMLITRSPDQKRIVLEDIGRWHDASTRRTLVEDLRGIAAFGIYLTLMLNSKSTVLERVDPQPALNKKRMKLGREPRDARRVVKITPAYERDTATSGGGDRPGTGAPRRLRWRRSHLRHYRSPTPHSVWLPSANHKGETGWYVAVIPRMLVGRAEVGCITHDYVFKGAQL